MLVEGNLDPEAMSANDWSQPHVFVLDTLFTQIAADEAVVRSNTDFIKTDTVCSRLVGVTSLASSPYHVGTPMARNLSMARCSTQVNMHLAGGDAGRSWYTLGPINDERESNLEGDEDDPMAAVGNQPRDIGSSCRVHSWEGYLQGGVTVGATCVTTCS